MSGDLDARLRRRRAGVRQAAERGDALYRFVRDRLNDGDPPAPDAVLLAQLAATWARHPDYDPAWSPPPTGEPPAG